MVDVTALMLVLLSIDATLEELTQWACGTVKDVVTLPSAKVVVAVMAILCIVVVVMSLATVVVAILCIEVPLVPE